MADMLNSASDALRRLACAHPLDARILDPEGDGICVKCGAQITEPDLEACMLRVFARIRDGRL